MVLNAAALSAAQGQSYTDDAVLQYAKSVDVAKLDSTLSSRRLAHKLLQDLVPKERAILPPRQ